MTASKLDTPARPIRFVHQGRVQEVAALPATTTVLQWLREQAHCIGSKEGCAEGDCGACTVVVGERNEATGQWQERTVNACIQFLPTLDGKALLTVEDITAQEAPQLHPCQQAMVDCHGSQCGFCTPGFVMSMWHLYEGHDSVPAREDVADALAGNLCRCTGYRPILDAAQQMFEAPRVRFDPNATLALLDSLDDDGELVFDSAPLPSAPAQRHHFVAPRTLDSLAQWRETLPQATLLAGSTDIGLWVNKQFKDLGDVIYLGRVGELQHIRPWGTDALQPEGLEIGAGVNLEAAWSTLATHIPSLREVWLRFASPPVRHAGTLGGNLANGSPIGDSAPILLALGASLVLRRGAHTREVPLADFYLGYMRNDLQSGEFVQSIKVPMPLASRGEVMRGYKVSKRRDSDISALCAGLWLKLDGDTIVDARLGWGGMAATAQRAAQAEAALRGQPWTEATLRRAQAALAQDFAPLNDLRATASYRQRVAGNLLERLWLETRPVNALASSQTQVWPTPA